MFLSAWKWWTTTYGSVWNEWTVCKGTWCLWSRDRNSTSLQQNNNKDRHRDATIRSIFSQIDLPHNHSHPPQDLHTAKYTRNRDKATHTHTCHHQVNLLTDRSQRNHSHAPHDLLPAKYTRNRNKATHTHTHATVRSFFSQIDLQRNHLHAPHDLLPAKYTRNRKKATFTHATVRSLFSQIDLQRNHSHAPHDLQSAKYTRNRNKGTHTHTCHRQVNLLSDRSSTQPFTCATRLTSCKIHTQ